MINKVSKNIEIEGDLVAIKGALACQFKASGGRVLCQWHPPTEALSGDAKRRYEAAQRAFLDDLMHGLEG